MCFFLIVNAELCFTTTRKILESSGDWKSLSEQLPEEWRDVVNSILESDTLNPAKLMESVLPLLDDDLKAKLAEFMTNEGKAFVDLAGLQSNDLSIE